MNKQNQKNESKPKEANDQSNYLLPNYSNSNVIVAVRCRPLSANEKSVSTLETIKIINGNMISIIESIDNQKAKTTKEQQFHFDMVFDKKTTQKEVYEKSTKFLITGIIDGFNATVLAYGATGSGKTYSMLGTQKEPGLMQRSVIDIFQLIKKQKNNNEFKIKLSYIEVYNENIHDLLGNEKVNLDLREDPNKGVIINGVKEIEINSVDNFFSLLLVGNSKRAVEVTYSNTASSRSHAVLQILLENRNNQKKETTVSRFVLVDLAGSERSSGISTSALAQRQLEGSKINQSLLTLGKCINALSENKSFISWRDSKLTRILKDSLIGNSRMIMLSTISPSILCIAETINTLLYSSRAKNIKVKVKRNTVDNEANIESYENVINGLVKELDELRYKLALKTHNQYLSQQDSFNNNASFSVISSKAEKLYKEISMHFSEEMKLKFDIFDQEKLIQNTELTLKEKEYQLYKSLNKKKSEKFMLSLKEKDIKSSIALQIQQHFFLAFLLLLVLLLSSFFSNDNLSNCFLEFLLKQ